jgi:hypothetical protein
VSELSAASVSLTVCRYSVTERSSFSSSVQPLQERSSQLAFSSRIKVTLLSLRPLPPDRVPQPDGFRRKAVIQI